MGLELARMSRDSGLALPSIDIRLRASICAPVRSRRMENNPKLNPGGDGETIEVTDARGAQKTGYMRWVLVISTALAVVAVVIAWFVMRP